MLKIQKGTLSQLEQLDPGVVEQINDYEIAMLPSCMNCGSDDTAVVHCGIVRRSINIAAATTKFKLIANNPKLGSYFCNKCNKYFS